MRYRALTGLLVLNAALLVVWLLLWFTPTGDLREQKWVAPELKVAELPVAPDLTMALGAGSDGTHLRILDRPLFSPDRRAIAVAAANAPDVAADLNNVQVSGVFGGSGFGGMIATVDGKLKRVLLGETVNGWTLRNVDATQVTLVRGEETRSIRAEKRKITAPSAADSVGEKEAPKAAGPESSVASDEANKQRLQDESRATLARRNALRAKAGLPPVKE